MNEQAEQRDDFDGWPLWWPAPSRDVLRELDRPALTWFEPEPDGDHTQLAA